MPIQTIAILGAGKVGIVLAQLALKAGYSVYIAGSGDPKKITLTTKVLTPGAIATTSAHAARSADVIILALPLSKHQSLPAAEMKEKLVIDAMNYWWEVDGEQTNLIRPGLTSSETVQAFLSGSRVVKAFSHMGYHDLYDEARPSTTPGRKAIAVAGDNADDVIAVSDIVDKFGFDPVAVGALANSGQLEPGGDAFGANEPADTLLTLLGIRAG